MNKRVHTGKLLIGILLLFGSVLMLAPFVWVFSASLRPFKEAITLPPKWLPPAGSWDFSYYKRLFEISIPFSVFFKNSIVISAVITLGMLVHGTLAGYAYARLQFKGKNVMFAMMLITMMVPAQVTIIPLYQMMAGWNLINTSFAVTLPSLFGAAAPGLSGAFGIFLMRQFFKILPKEMEEAASIDGAGPIRTFVSIMLPQAKAIIASLAIIVFSMSWNDYFTAFIMINKTEKMPLPVGILAIRQPFATGDQFELAAVVLSILPVLLFFLLGQKWIVKSMVQAGIKG